MNKFGSKLHTQACLHTMKFNFHITEAFSCSPVSLLDFVLTYYLPLMTSTPMSDATTLTLSPTPKLRRSNAFVGSPAGSKKSPSGSMKSYSIGSPSPKKKCPPTSMKKNSSPMAMKTFVKKKVSKPIPMKAMKVMKVMKAARQKSSAAIDRYGFGLYVG